MEVQELKKRYAEYEKKFTIPAFKELNEAFEIDKIDRDSDCFLRVVRKALMEKIVNSLSFVEMFLNPVNAPRLYFSFIRSMTNEDKEILNRLYDKLSDLSLNSMALEVDYNEKDEAELIKKTFDTWASIRPEFRKLVQTIRKPNNSVKKEKSYFG